MEHDVVKSRHAVSPTTEWSASSIMIVAGLTVASFFSYTDRNAVAVLIEPIKKSLALTDTQIGLVTGIAFALFYAFMGVPIGRLADRRNKVQILALCFLLWSLVTALSGLAFSFTSLFALRLLVGVGEAGCFPTSFSIISERFSPQQRPLAISIFQAGGKLGVALGTAGAGLIGELFGWRAALISLGLAGFPATLLVLWLLRGADDQGSTVRTRDKLPERVRLIDIVRFPRFASIVTAISLASFGTYAISQWLPAFFMRSYGTSLKSVGLWIGLSSGVGGLAGTLAGGVAAGFLIRRHQNWDLWLPALSYFLATPIFVAALLSPTVGGASFLYFVATLVSTVGGGVALAAFQRFTFPEQRATANAVMLMISALTGIGLGPVVVGVLSDGLKTSFGPDSLRFALVICMSTFAGAGAFFYLAARGIKPAATERTER
jgi:predicted MFS family arabinose efflux permease